MKRLLSFLIVFCLVIFNQMTAEKKSYHLTNDPIDVVIVTHPKDAETLEMSIDGIRKYGENIRRVIVVSSEKITDKAEWFDEKQYPFSMSDIILKIGRGSKSTADKYFKTCNRGPGWYLQQCLKLYAPYVIPDISTNVLILDADAVFMNPTSFMNEKNGGLFCVSYKVPKERYFDHAKRMNPDYERIYPKYYSVCHHMLFQKAILDDYFNIVESHHKMHLWEAFCLCVDINERKKSASEYECYYNFALRNSDQVAIRKLKWLNSGEIEKMPQFQKEGYNFVAFHTYLRKHKKTPFTFLKRK